MSQTGRQKIAEKYRNEMLDIGYAMLHNKPNDIRKVLQKEMVATIEGEDLGKFLRFSMELAKIDKFLRDDVDDLAKVYWKSNLNKLDGYKTGLALEQDASASGGQIIALTTRNKKLAELTNVIPTDRKKRLFVIGLYKLREFRENLIRNKKILSRALSVRILKVQRSRHTISSR
jgi:hypothetical protein